MAKKKNKWKVTGRHLQLKVNAHKDRVLMETLQKVDINGLSKQDAMSKLDNAYDNLEDNNYGL